MASIIASLMSVLVAVALAECGDVTSGPSQPGHPQSGSWERLLDPPLSAREAALGLSIGREVFVVGGSDADPCPPSASCAPASEPPLRDGAAFDPKQRAWRQIAPAPVGFSFGEGVVVGGTAYILTHGERGRPDAPPAFLGYRRVEDRWEDLPLPPGDRSRSITATDEQVVAFTNSDEGGEAPDLMFDPRRPSGPSCPTTHSPGRSTGRWRGAVASWCCSRTRSCHGRVLRSRRS
jgi:hypothetical protein